jgi:two-component system, chemotaxis family, protein-glutamate methylesterase/glutaminase
MDMYQKILVVEDEVTNSILLKRIMTKAGYQVSTANNGEEAINLLKKEQFDAILTDWMMPHMDGIELIRQTRLFIKPIPFIMMITALVSENARDYALESGADDFISKPIDIDELIARVKDGISRHTQLLPDTNIIMPERANGSVPGFVGIVIGTSTGGPPTLIEIFKNLKTNPNASYFIVQHGPPWMLETFCQRLQKETNLKVKLAQNEILSEPGNVYIAPGEKHMKIEQDSFRILLDDGPKENFVRPAVDPLFRSAAHAFGKYCIGVILTGLGRDGALGAAQVTGRNGIILVQDPDTAIAPSMPNTIIQSGIPHKVVALADMAEEISSAASDIYSALKNQGM